MLRLVVLVAIAGTGCSASVNAPDLGSTAPSSPQSGDVDVSADVDVAGGGTMGGDAPGATDDAPAPAQDLATVHYVGRFTDDGKFGWSGGGAVARFNGTGIAVQITGSPNMFAGYIDGALVKTFPQADDPTVIADNLAAGEHTVAVYRRSEASFNASELLGFTVTGGDLVASPYPFAHRLQFVGDSITCGYGDLGVNGTCFLDLDTESEMMAYGWLTAQALNAEAHIIAWSGKGMYRQYNDGDGETPSPEQMPELYERNLPTVTTSTWDHTRYVPDVIVINLGTNDWASGDPGTPYETAYVAFVRHLRTLYANAEIFCTLGPMQTSAPALARVQNVVNTLADDRVHYVPFAAQLDSDGQGCNSHPSVTTHAKMATTLEQAIRDVTGW